jgi:hypothetical protein
VYEVEDVGRGRGRDGAKEERDGRNVWRERETVQYYQ